MDENLRTEDEAAFVRRLADYDPEAWQSVYRLYYKPLFRLAYVRTFQITLSEDIAAEALAEAARGIRRYEYRGVPFRAWLFRIANNLIADYHRAQSRRPQVYLDEAAEVEGLAATDAFESVEATADFFMALESLTAEQKTALTLRFVNDLSLAEVAASMGKTAGAVKQLQHRALSALKRRLSPKESTKP